MALRKTRVTLYLADETTRKDHQDHQSMGILTWNGGPEVETFPDIPYSCGTVLDFHQAFPRSLWNPGAKHGSFGARLTAVPR